MSREDLVKTQGTVVEPLSGGLFLVTLKDGRQLKAKISGRLRKFHISVIAGDSVTIGMSPYDLSHGLILGREKLPPRAPSTYKPNK